MKNKDIAEMFAQGKRNEGVDNLFIEGNAIYSYGKHFPIAIRLWDGNGYKYIWNKDKYSVTTSRQQSIVLKAIGKDKIIKEVITPEMEKYKKFTEVKEVIIEALD